MLAGGCSMALQSSFHLNVSIEYILRDPAAPINSNFVKSRARLNALHAQEKLK